jgi:frataxin-like iron-binding protein CyaY
VLRDLDIVFAKCMMNSEDHYDEQASDDVSDDFASIVPDNLGKSVSRLMSELCGRSGTRAGTALPKPEELLSWCLEQHFDVKDIDVSSLLDVIADDIKLQEEVLKAEMNDKGKFIKSKEDAEKRLFLDMSEKLQKWKQIVDTWLVFCSAAQLYFKMHSYCPRNFVNLFSLPLRYSISRNASSAKEELETLSEEIMDKLNEVHIVEEASVHVMSIVSGSQMLIPNMYTKDCVSLMFEFLSGSVDLFLRIPMQEARSDVVMDLVFACDGIVECLTQYQQFLPKIAAAASSAVQIQSALKQHVARKTISQLKKNSIALSATKLGEEQSSRRYQGILSVVLHSRTFVDIFSSNIDRKNEGCC